MSPLAPPDLATRPGPAEYAPFYSTYVDGVPEGDILETLTGGLEETARVLASFHGDRETRRYAPGKWSVREVVGHVVDTERVFAYRALSIARRDPAALPGMDQEVWALGSNAQDRPLEDLERELAAVRSSSLALFRSFPADAWKRRGMASGNSFTVRSLAWIVAGHEIHHRRVLAERY